MSLHFFLGLLSSVAGIRRNGVIHAIVLLTSLCGLNFFSSASLWAADQAVGVEFFEKKIRPVLVQHCYECHSAEAAKKQKLKGALRVDSREALLKGGDSGPAIAPGNASDSLLLDALRYETLQMPPKGKLSEEIIADFAAWIAMGAPGPESAPEAIAAKPTDRTFDPLSHWAFRPPVLPEIPQVIDSKWTRGPLDHFVLAELEKRRLKPVRPATKREWLRRVTFDLIGLPPTPAELKLFEQDTSPKAYEDVVNRLLASPHHGERWARYWLDIARYAEDQAYNIGNTAKESAYRYRDWVIEALNADMPFDRFATLQIAGDLAPPVPPLAGAVLAGLADDTDPALFTQRAGLGFFGLGAQYYKGNPSAVPQATADELDDRVDTLTRGFLGLTVACARCHDHKFDPIPTKDYYSLAGIFHGSKLTQTPLVESAVVRRYDDAMKLVDEQQRRIKAALQGFVDARIDREIDRLPETLRGVWKVQVLQKSAGDQSVRLVADADRLTNYFLARWVKLLDPKGTNYLPETLLSWRTLNVPALTSRAVDEVTVPTEVDAVIARFVEELSATRVAVAHKVKLTKEQKLLQEELFTGKLGPLFIKPTDYEATLAGDDEKKELAELRSELQSRVRALPPMYPVAHVLQGGGRGMRVYLRGNPENPGEPVPPGYLPEMSDAMQRSPARRAAEADRELSADSRDVEFTRLDLAEEIASPDNPLTARVIVNRVWEWHFGIGIVGTASNFGHLGDRPTHPELLDWLTVRFIESGWSLKWLHRQIVLSSTYRASSETCYENAEIDGTNQWLWRMHRRRLDVEAWRDSLLAVAGNLDPGLGGPTFDLKDCNVHRRTVYARISRHSLDELLRLFDFPDANVSAARRTVTTVPQQQLFALNSEFMQNQARAFSNRLRSAGINDEARIVAAYQLAFGRSPAPTELNVGMQFLALPPGDNADRLSRWEQYAQALLASNELLYID